MTPDTPHPAGWMRSLPSERRARGAGEWNHYRISAQNGTIKLAVNGKVVSGGYDIAPRKGYIHLESEGGEVLYRNLRIKELPSAGTLPPDQIAQADEGFVSIYNGKDFDGWQYPKGHNTHWVSKDWTITYDGNSEADGKDLWSGKAFGDVTFIADWRRPKAAADAAESDAIPLRIEGIDLPAAARVPARASSGGKPAAAQWHRAIVTRRGGRLTVTVDGETVVKDAPVSTARGRIGLRHEGAPIEFANIFVKE
jgi:hypothetical protein